MRSPSYAFLKGFLGDRLTRSAEPTTDGILKYFFKAGRDDWGYDHVDLRFFRLPECEIVHLGRAPSEGDLKCAEYARLSNIVATDQNGEVRLELNSTFSDSPEVPNHHTLDVHLRKSSRRLGGLL